MSSKSEKLKTAITNFMNEIDECKNETVVIGYACDNKIHKGMMLGNAACGEPVCKLVRNLLQQLYEGDKNQKQLAESIMIGALLAMIDNEFVHLNNDVKPDFYPKIFN